MQTGHSPPGHCQDSRTRTTSRHLPCRSHTLHLSQTTGPGSTKNVVAKEREINMRWPEPARRAGSGTLPPVQARNCPPPTDPDISLPPVPQWGQQQQQNSHVLHFFLSEMNKTGQAACKVPLLPQLKRPLSHMPLAVVGGVSLIRFPIFWVPQPHPAHHLGMLVPGACSSSHCGPLCPLRAAACAPLAHQAAHANRTARVCTAGHGLPTSPLLSIYAITEPSS